MGLSRRRAIAAVGGSVLLSGCQSPAGTPRLAAGTTDDSQLHTFLTRRNEALRDGDETAWLADVDPGNQALLDHERTLFANLRRFDFATLEFHRDSAVPVAPRPLRYATSLPMRTAAYQVELRMRLRDVDTADNATRHRYVFGHVDGVFTMVDVAAGTAESPGAEFVLDYPWDLDPLRVHRRGDVVVAADDSVQDLDGYLDAAERASRAVRRDWGTHPAPAAFALFLTAATSSHRTWFGGDPDWSEGLQIPVRARGATGAAANRYAGARCTVNLTAGRPGATRYETLKHHLAHAVSMSVIPAEFDIAPVTDGPRDTTGAPRWATEGFARYLELREAPAGRDRLVIRDGLRRGLFDGQLPGNAAFHAEQDRAFHYALGRQLFQYTADRHGHDKAVELYVALVGQRDLSRTPAGSVLTAALATTGLETRRPPSTKDSLFHQQWLRHLQRL